MSETSTQTQVKGNNKAVSADFKSALVLLAIAIFFIVETLSYPMSGDYGGVESQWFVSPALFPLVILSCLAICALVMLFGAIKHQGFRQFFTISAWIGSFKEQKVRDRWYVIFVLAVYAYALIPSVDFYLASLVFLCSLTTRFYYPSQHNLAINILVNSLLVMCLYLIKMSWFAADDMTFLSVNQDETVIFYSDICALLSAASMLVLNALFPVNRQLSKFITNALVILFIPLVLTMIFSYLLFVPMPVEYGSVISKLDYLVYEVWSQ